MNLWKLGAGRSFWLVASCVVAIAVASATTFAQAPPAQPKLQPLVEPPAADRPAAVQPTAGQPKATAPASRADEMSVDEQLRTCDKYLGEMKGLEGRTNQLVSKAEAKRDLIQAQLRQREAADHSHAAQAGRGIQKQAQGRGRLER